MSRRALLYAAAGVLLIGSLWYGWHQTMEAREARGAAESLREENRRDSVRLDSLRRAHARRDSLRVDTIRRLREDRRRSEREAERLRARADTLADRAAEAGESVDASVDSLRSSVSPPLRPVVDTLARQVDAERALHEAEKQALRLQIGEVEGQLASAEREIGVLNRRIEDRDERLRELTEALQSVREEAAAWEQAANPGFFSGFARAVPQVLSGAGAVLVLALML